MMLSAKMPLTAGSPPRAWGILRSKSHSRPRDFGSPPRAWGIPSRRPQNTRRLTVHPHVRGEYAAIFRRAGTARRFTPTCVGNTRPYDTFTQWLAVHPHVRGEYSGRSVAVTRTYGSPPRAWGIPSARSKRRRGERFTPTCVGNTSPFAPAGRPSSGSPPRAWGIRHTVQAIWPLCRFTPTCVGNTLHQACTRSA